MDKNPVLTKVLAVTGLILAWLPIVAPMVFSLLRLVSIATRLGIRSILAEGFLLDYLMPAEMFPAALGGAVMLLWAAIRVQSRRRLIGWGIGALMGGFAGCMLAASATGLASGATQPVGWPWILVIGLLALYILALTVVAVSGILLVRDVFREDSTSLSA